MPRIIKPQARGAKPLSFTTHWIPSMMLFSIVVEDYGSELETAYPAFFRVLHDYGRPSVNGTWDVHALFWMHVKKLATRWSEAHCTMFGDGLRSFADWYKEQTKIPTPDLKSRCSVWKDLRWYQRQAVAAMLIKPRYILGFDMGLGKTLAILATWECLGCPRMIVVVPSGEVATGWEDELKRFMPHLGPITVLSNAMQEVPRSGILVTTYAKARMPVYYSKLEEFLAPEANSIVVLDEGHRASRCNSQQHDACYNLGWEAERLIISTGTEVSCTPDEYFGIARMVMPMANIYPANWNNYFKEGKTWNFPRLEELKFLRQALGIKRRKEEVANELPPLTVIDITLEMDPLQARLYREIEVFSETEVLREYGNVTMTEQHFLTVYLRLMQFSSHPLLLGETRVTMTPKTTKLLELLDGAGDQQVLVWSNWPGTIDHLEEQVAAAGYTVGAAHGKKDDNTRKRLINNLRSGNVQVGIANPAVWGEGTNLQCCSIMIDYDYHPSSVRWEQGRARLHRPGQTKPVTSYRLIHKNSIDKVLLDWLAFKKTLGTKITG